MAESFYDVLTESVAWFAEHGYTSAEELAAWQRRLREAAAASFIPESDMLDQLRAALAATYRRLVDQGQILQHHPGIQAFTYERIKPHLRAELDRRIFASADLIKLNRQQTIEDTIRRFSGWVSSVPASGSRVVDRREEKARIRKPLASAPYVERRVLIDQNAKLQSAIHDILAKDGGAIAGRWRAVHRPGYDNRPEHLARDGKVFAIRDCWALEKGLMNKGPNGYTDEIEQPAEFVYCSCRYVYYYGLAQLPADMLTARGREALDVAKTKALA
jgi:hypothetical protein